MERVQAGDIELSYERSGAGEPLLLIMGMSGTALHWGEPFLEELRRDFELIVYDHRGVGRSSRLEGSVTTAQMASDAAALLDALEVPSAHVLGISMGGMIAQELALAQPERVRTLGLGCTYCGGAGSAQSSPGVLTRLRAAMASGDRALALRTAWEINVSPAMAADEQAYERFLDIAARYVVAVPVVMAQLEACHAHDTSARLGQLEMPTVIIHGTLDQLLPVENAYAIAGHMPAARLEILEDVGHLFFWERPEQAAALVRANAAVPA
jgi:pimeloyl-ACP methyl ester carboxylesterase